MIIVLTKQEEKEVEEKDEYVQYNGEDNINNGDNNMGIRMIMIMEKKLKIIAKSKKKR